MGNQSAGGFSALGFRQRLPDCPLLPDFAKRIGRCEPWLHATAWRNTLLMFSFSYFSFNAFIKKNICFHSMSFFIRHFIRKIPTLSHRQSRYTATLTTLWQADLLAWKKRYGCEVGNPVGKPVGNHGNSDLHGLLRLLRLLH